MKLSTLASVVAVAAFLTGGAAFALDAAKPAASPAASPASSPASSAKSAKSEDCSKQADAKSLHGKERKKFREECKKGK